MAAELSKAKLQLQIADDNVVHKDAVIRSMMARHDVLLPSMERRACEREQVRVSSSQGRRPLGRTPHRAVSQATARSRKLVQRSYFRSAA